MNIPGNSPDPPEKPPEVREVFRELEESERAFSKRLLHICARIDKDNLLTQGMFNYDEYFISFIITLRFHPPDTVIVPRDAPFIALPCKT